MLFKFDYFVELIFKVFGYVGVTLRLAFVTLIIAFILALALAIIRHYEVPVLNNISKVYVSFFRSTPYISQLFLFYFGLAQIFPFVRTMSSSAALIITLAANSSAFMCESIRGSFLSVDKGQIEAAQAMGMTNLQMMRRVILPLSNNFISLTKSTSIGFTVGVVDMMGKAKLEAANSFRFTEAYAAALVVYWIVIAILTMFQSKIEAKLKQSY